MTLPTDLLEQGKIACLSSFGRHVSWSRPAAATTKDHDKQALYVQVKRIDWAAPPPRRRNLRRRLLSRHTRRRRLNRRNRRLGPVLRGQVPRRNHAG